ncbi:MAG: tol-pal system protein YbgF [Emcibacteraceae bacterium]|nr:tol-pal system protein YbgF [Emcibacteraceae bacterium]
MLNRPLTFKVNIMSTFILAVIALVILISTTDTSSAQSTRQRLTAIEKQLNAIQRRVFTPGSRFESADDAPTNGNAPVISNVPTGGEGALMADINIRISELEMQIRQLTGQLEEANFKVNNLTGQLETLQKDNEFRFGEIERGGASGGGVAVSSPNGSVNIMSPAVAANATPKQKYDRAYGFVSNANYDKAEIGFLEFLEQHPDDELAGNAQYWLGQTYYARGNYNEAARTFLVGMQKYSESPKAPAYLLKVGMSLNLMGQKKDACDVYRDLSTQFPNSTENTRLRPTEERKAGCS